MSVRLKVDQQGRVVLPLRERERLGVARGGTLELISTPEGVLLERHRPATVQLGGDGLPVIKLSDTDQVSNEESLDAIHREREQA